MTDNSDNLTDDYRRLFLEQVPLIDTRAPVEFAKGSFPGATNLPLMTDDERAAVGTCYKQQGQAAAIALGHQLVSGDVKAQRVAAWTTFARAHPGGALFCFRGGMRSAITQEWLTEAGYPLPRVAGGYKAMRSWLSGELERLCQRATCLVVAGATGAAKTRLINEGCQGGPYAATVDLEGLANHRGSSFGRRYRGQPTQINFETALAVAVLRGFERSRGRLLVEDESRLIGRCSLPAPVQAMKTPAPIVLVESSLDERVRHSYENYILDNLEELRQAIPDETEAFGQFADDLLAALDRVRKRLGGVRHKALRAVMTQALESHRKGGPEAHLAWIEPLLRDYYDPMYAYQLQTRHDQVVFRGSSADVAEYLLEWSA